MEDDTTLIVNGVSISADELVDTNESELDDFEIALADDDKVRSRPSGTVFKDNWDHNEEPRLGQRHRSPSPARSPARPLARPPARQHTYDREDRGRRRQSREEEDEEDGIMEIETDGEDSDVSPSPPPRHRYSRSPTPQRETLETRKRRIVARKRQYDHEEHHTTDPDRSLRVKVRRRKITPHDKERDKPTAHSKRDGSDTGYAVVGEPQGCDFRGIPFKNYMGIMMPDYERIDLHTNKMLRMELEVRQQAVTGVYGDIQFHKYEDDNDRRILTLMHYEYYTKNKLAEARTNATKWSSGIMAFSSAVEVGGTALGIPLTDLTSASAKVLAYAQPIVLDLAHQEGSPLPSMFSPRVQLAALFVINGIFFAACKAVSLPKSQQGSDTYNQITEMVGQTYRYFVPQPQAATGTTAAGDPASPFPAPASGPPAPGAGIWGGGIGEVVTNIGSMASGVMRAFTASPSSDTATVPQARTAERRQARTQQSTRTRRRAAAHI